MTRLGEPRPVHGGDVYSAGNGRAVDFSANLNPLGMPESVKSALRDSIEGCALYPDPMCRELRAALGGYEGCSGESIFCGNGATEIIFRLASAFRPRRALVLAPTFSEYRRAVECAGGEVFSLLLKEDAGFEPDEDLPERLPGGADMVFLCNPNNPTGVPIGRELIRRAAGRCREAGALLVVDECFMDFLPDGGRERTAKPLLGEFGNLVVLKAFTKIFAMAGLRLGYCMASDASIVDRLSLCGQPWAVSVPAQRAGVAASKELEFVSETRRYVAREREALRAALRSFGLKVYPSESNYLLFRVEGVHNLREGLRGRGFLIRSCAEYEGLDRRYYRIAVRTSDENRALIAALGGALGPDAGTGR